METTVVVMIIIGIVMSFASFFLSERLTKKEENLHLDLMTVDEDYEFSERELRIIKRKIEDVIANQAKDILYETNESLSSMANEKTLALGDYAVTVCEEIEKNHREVMFLYSMLDDKQKEIMKTVKMVDALNQEVKETTLSQVKKEVNVEISNQNLSNDEMISRKEEVVHQPEELISSSDESENSDLEDMEDVFAELDQTDVDFDEVLDEEFKENENSNDIILEMHRNGSSIIDIAKQLGLGVGEVKLVIDLYRGEQV